MELTAHLHHARHLLGIVRVRLLGVVHKPGDFPTLVGILVNERAVQAELLGLVECSDFSAAVNEELGAHAGMAIDVLSVVGRKVAAEVGQSLL